MDALKTRIEKKAYEIFLRRGAQDGHHFDDWVKAEKEVMAEMAKEKTSNVFKSAPPAQKKPMFPTKSPVLKKR
jgi:hypothetical protein